METKKTIGDRIDQLMREAGRARHEGASPYTQDELVKMLNGDMIAPDGKCARI